MFGTKESADLSERLRNAVNRRPKRRPPDVTLGQQFDPRRNALNAWRLLMASGVILWHSWPLTGRQVSFAPAHQFLQDVFVDGFFAMSGFLITWSWFKNPRLRDFALARSLRILPGLWVCLIITAFVIAPLTVLIHGGSAAKLLLSNAPYEYVLKNSVLPTAMSDIDGTPTGVPMPGVWNGSLWTLVPEMFCYIAVAVLGLTRLLSRRWITAVALALATLASAILPRWDLFIEDPAVLRDPKMALPVFAAVCARFSIMFLSGAFVYQFRNVIPVRWSLVAVCLAIVAVSNLLPNYRVLSAIPLAYALIVSGALVRNKHLRLRTDLSYGMYIYAFQMQQLLIIFGLGILHPIVFAIAAAVTTLPWAAMSWFLVETPALSLKSRLVQRRRARVAGVKATP